MASGAPRFRPDIQGLRAVAVLLVLGYHVAPQLVPGGYVGVDVFFVISGYLITSVLLGGVATTGRLSFADFYTRRIKRLLPAATLVLVTVALCTPLLPESRRSPAALELAASALYVQNYWLAHQARDYLTADDPASPVQHYWSLSVEEQFYIGWPVLLWLALRLAPRFKVRPHAAAGWAIGVLGAASLAYGLWLTASAPSQAYFSTLARAWELAIGSVWAVLARGRTGPDAARLPAAAPGALGAVGVASMVAAAALFDANTAFPGYAALLPTLGAGAIIVAGSLAPRWPGDLVLRNPVMQYVGDRSYALYLWHWPVLVLLEAGLVRELTTADRALVVVSSLALAHVTKRWVEDPCRAPSFASQHARQPFVLAGLWVVISVAAAGLVYRASAPEPRAGWARAVPGAAVLAEPGYDFRNERIDALVPPPAYSTLDVASAHVEGCYQNIENAEALVCSYGSVAAKLRIAVVGDSHAMHWFPAFEELAARRDVRVFGIAKQACAFSLAMVQQNAQARPYSECLRWTRNVIALLVEHEPDVILIAQASNYRIGGSTADADIERVAAGMGAAWRELTARGLRVMALASTPSFPRQKLPRECVSVSKDWLRECVAARGEVLSRDAVRAAAEATGTVLIDLNDAFCAGDRCSPVIGGALVYGDHHHITATYARTTAPIVARALAAHGVHLPAE